MYFSFSTSLFAIVLAFALTDVSRAAPATPECIRKCEVEMAKKIEHLVKSYPDPKEPTRVKDIKWAVVDNRWCINTCNNP
ncbi:hypothetical protein BGW41_006720 [Actinomortierella wolfii]|nr:hypothetical protein BGW41_006720 [Actinomortierella wolfii]